MTQPIHSVALFRLAVLGPLATRDRLEPGELKQIIHELAGHTHSTPGQKLVRLSYKTIERWYYAWRRGGIDGLVPKARHDRGHSHIPTDVQEAILAAKQACPTRSVNTLIRLLEQQGIVAHKQLARSSVHGQTTE